MEDAWNNLCGGNFDERIHSSLGGTSRATMTGTICDENCEVSVGTWEGILSLLNSTSRLDAANGSNDAEKNSPRVCSVYLCNMPCIDLLSYFGPDSNRRLEENKCRGTGC